MYSKLRTLSIWFGLLCSSMGYAQKLQVQETAPLFIIKDSKGTNIQLDQYKGQKVLLSFFRYVGCPVCNMRMHELISKQDSLKNKGYQIIAVFESDPATLQSYLLDNPLDFPVIGDPELALYKKYGVKKSTIKMMRTMFKKRGQNAAKQGQRLFKGKKYKRDGNLRRIPADFVIDENGKITIAHYGNYLADHLPLENLLK